MSQRQLTEQSCYSYFSPIWQIYCDWAWNRSRRMMETKLWNQCTCTKWSVAPKKKIWALKRYTSNSCSSELTKRLGYIDQGPSKLLVTLTAKKGLWIVKQGTGPPALSKVREVPCLIKTHGDWSLSYRRKQLTFSVLFLLKSRPISGCLCLCAVWLCSDR